MIDFNKVDDILAADKAVRYVGVIDLEGNIIASKNRGGGRQMKMRYSDLTSAS